MSGSHHSPGAAHPIQIGDLVKVTIPRYISTTYIVRQITTVNIRISTYDDPNEYSFLISDGDGLWEN